MKKIYFNINILKAVAIIIVIIEHSKWTNSIWRIGLFPFWDRIAIPCFMAISGYVYSNAIQRDGSIKEYYSKKNLFRRIKRYLLPFVIAYFIEIIAYYICANTNVINLFNFNTNNDFYSYFKIINIFEGFVIGGYGPGNYYTPVIIQLVLIFPLLYKLVKKYKYKALAGSFAFCFLFEIIQYRFGFSNLLYRSLICRHVFNISFGIYIYLGYWKKNKILNFLSMLVGFIYIIAHSYYGYTPYFFYKGFADVNFVACLFFMPIVGYLICRKDIKCRFLESIGKASYHIYLTQMVYYNFIKKELIMSIIGNNYLYAIINVIICVSIGYLFYLFNNKLVNICSKTT